MDCPGDILRGQPYGHAGREDCPRKESGDQFRKVHGSAGRQAAGMLRHDLPDPIRETGCMDCDRDYCQRVYHQRIPPGGI